MKKTTRSVLNGAAVLTVSTLFVKAIGLIFKIPLSYIISDEGMGYFNTAYTVFTFFYILSTAGVPKAVSILVASKMSEENSSEARQISKSAFRSFFLIGLFSGFLFAVLSKPISYLIGSQKSALAMIAVAPSIAFVASSGAIRGYFMGRMKFLPVAISEIISAAVKLILGLLLAFLGYSLGFDVYLISALAILGVTLGSFFGFIYLYIVEKKSESSVSTPIGKANNKYLKDIIKIASPITLSSAISSLINLLDIAVVMRMLRFDGFSELQANIIYGNYTTCVIPVFNLVGAILAPVGMIILPMLIKVKDNPKEFSSLLNKGVNTVIYISTPLSVLVFCYARSILMFLFEDSSAVMSSFLLQLIAPSFILLALLLILNTALEAKGNFKIPVISLSIGAITKLLVSALFITGGNLGIVAAPVGTLSSYIVSFSISFFYIVHKYKCKIRLLLPLVISITFCFACMIFSTFFDEKVLIKNFYIKSVLTYFIFAIIYIVLYIILILLKKLLKSKQISQN